MVSFSPSSILMLAILWILYRILVALYNISPFHPLYSFPGSKLAAASYCYEAYHDWWRTGRYGRVIARMHENYGPVVRISPDELHCNDPLFTDEIFAGSGRVRDKWQHHVNTNSIGPMKVTSIATISHELHRSRKAPLAKFFSRQQMLKLEDEVHQFAQATIKKLLTFAGKGAIEVKEAYNCFAGDVISQYVFGENLGFVSQEGWEPNLTSWLNSFTGCAYMLRHNPFARKLADLMPSIADYLGNDVRTLVRLMNVTIPGYVKAALDNPDHGRVFSEIQDKSGTLSEEDLYRYNGEGFLFMLAGTETTSATLTAFTYWMLAKPDLHQRLLSDLSRAGINADNLRWLQLEKVTYLWAVLQECLRVMPGISHRSTRVAREETLHYKSARGDVEWLIPKGTPISMTSMINHWNTELFPSPDEFLPERWILPDGEPNRQLERRSIAFGKGSRSCIGEQLAYCELYIMAALMALCVLPRAKLVDTTVEDITYDHDLFVVQTKKGPISVRIAIE